MRRVEDIVVEVSEEAPMSVGDEVMSIRCMRRLKLYMYGFGGVVSTFAAPSEANLHGKYAWLHNFGRVRVSV